MNIFHPLSLLQVPVTSLTPWLGERQPPLSVLQAEHRPLPGSRSRAGPQPSPLGAAGPGRAARPVPIPSCLGGSPVGSALSAQWLDTGSPGHVPSWEAGIVSESSPACLAAALCLWREAGGLNSAFSSSLFHIWTGTTARDTFLFLQDQNRGGKNGKNVVCLPPSPPQRQHPGSSHPRGPALLLGIAEEILWQECNK